jgi:hypothetical protein
MTQENSTKWRVLFDLNVILDVLMHGGGPNFADAARLWVLAETHQIDGLVATHSITTLFCLYRRQTGNQGSYQAIRSLLWVYDVAGLDRKAIEKACDLGWRDFEYAIQLMAVSGSACDYLVTRNPVDYPDQDLMVVQPAQFLAVWASNQPGGI